MITLENNRLVFRFPDLHERATLEIDFQRTLRIPDNNRTYPLPPGLGRFPLRHVEDHADRLDGETAQRGGVLLPMRQAEALWINFTGSDSRGEPYPFAVKIATGKINAVTGEPWCQHLNADPQDYVVGPAQEWVDGYCVKRGVIRQFVAMPLGDGYSAEEQITGRAEVGGIQIMVMPMKAARYDELVEQRAFDEGIVLERAEDEFSLCTARLMTIAPGGRMRQEIHEDDHGLDAWDQRHASRCFVTIANAAKWMAITGERPPATPVTAEEYAEHGLPWFDHYAADKKAIEGAERLGLLKPVPGLPGDGPGVTPGPVIQLGEQRGRPVHVGNF